MVCVLLRVGLIGNPSDGFYGKTISFTINNFWAEVTVTESSRLVSYTLLVLVCHIVHWHIYNVYVYVHE